MICGCQAALAGGTNKAGILCEPSFRLEKNGRVKKAAGQHVSSESNVLSPGISSGIISAFAIHWSRVALHATMFPWFSVEFGNM